MAKAIPVVTPGPAKVEPGAHATGGMPLLRLGFRPFYLLASIFAAASILDAIRRSGTPAGRCTPTASR